MELKKTTKIENDRPKKDGVSPIVVMLVTGIFVFLAAMGNSKPNPFNSLYYHIITGDPQNSVSVSK